MNLIANRQNLKKHRKLLLAGFGEAEHKEKLKRLINFCEIPLKREPGIHPSHAVAERLRDINHILQTHGVESIYQWKTRESVDATNADTEDIIDIQYCNTGDTYGITILFWRGRFRIGDWRSIVERLSIN